MLLGTPQGILVAIIVSLGALGEQVADLLGRSLWCEALGDERMFFNLKMALRTTRRRAERLP
jgi:hypothetical protein